VGLVTDGNLEYRVEILERKITRLMSQVKELNDTLFSDEPIYVPAGDEDA
jgi:chaperonin cofactor prefoldin